MFREERTTSLPLVAPEEGKVGAFNTTLSEDGEVVLHMYVSYNFMKVDKQVLFKLLDQLNDSIEDNYYQYSLVDPVKPADASVNKDNE